MLFMDLKATGFDLLSILHQCSVEMDDYRMANSSFGFCFYTFREERNRLAMVARQRERRGEKKEAIMDVT